VTYTNVNNIKVKIKCWAKVSESQATLVYYLIYVNMTQI